VTSPDQESEEQYGMRTWFASDQYGFSSGFRDRIPPTVFVMDEENSGKEKRTD
jgi:hypothetical protein